MNRRIFRSNAWPWIALLFLWSTGGSVGILLASSRPGTAGEGQSVMAHLLGSGARVAAEYSVKLAERAYHGGRPYSEEKAFEDHTFQILQREMAPAGHVHLSGRKTGEMMPWLWFSLRLDPHNVDNYRTASYWLMRDMGLIHEAMNVLLEAQANNPDSYLVHLGKARIFAKIDNRPMAMKCFDRAIALWPSGMDPSDEEVRLDKRELLSRRAILREMEGDFPHAIEDMTEIVRLFPERTSGHFKQRISILEQGGIPADSAAQRWDALRNEEYQHLCAAEEAGHTEHQHEHE